MSLLRWLSILAAGIAVLIALAIAVGGLWLNTFIHSDGFRQEVETRAGQTLGGPVQIQAIDFSLFGGVKLRGVVTRVDSSRVNGQGALVATVESVDCTYALGDFLQRRLKLTGVTLEKPQIILTRQPIAAVMPVLPNDAAETGGDVNPAQAAPFQFILDGARIHDGNLSIRNAAGVSLSEFSGVDAEADTAGYYVGKNITGKLKIADLAFSPNFHITAISTTWIFDPRGNSITASPFAGTAFGGNLAGDYSFAATGPSLLDLNVKGLDVAQIGQTANPSSSVRLIGLLDGQSKWRGVETGHLNGEGDLQLAHGQLQGVRLLQNLAAILRVRELNDPRLDNVHTHFEVADGRTRFTGLQVDGGTFQMTGDGVIGTGGALDANMVLILSVDAMKRLPPEAAAFFVRQPNGSGSIAYHLGGTIDNPRTDLATRLLMQGAAVKNVISNAIDRFFHHRHHDDKASPVQTPPAEPAATPAPISPPPPNP